MHFLSSDSYFTADQTLSFDPAGYDTTHATIINFILAMVHHPEVQAKARSEVDRIVGPDRLPEFSDEEHLPYLKAVMKEVLR